MAYIKLSSANPDFSYVLQKNPATQEAAGKPFEKSLSGAKTYLWYENPQAAFLLSRIFENKKGKGFEYLNYDGLSSGSAYLQLINTQLRTASTVDQEKDTYPALLEFNIYNHVERDWSLSFPGKILSCNTEHKHSCITIQGDTVREALTICSIISLLAILHDDSVYIDESQYLKYLAAAVELTEHYPLLRSMASFIRSPVLFEKACEDFFDKTPFNFSIKRAYDARKDFYVDWIKKNELNLGEELLDLGCGEGGYFKLHSKYYKKVTAVESDPEVFIDATHTVRKVQLEDLVTLHEARIEDYLQTVSTLENTDVLITEVLEHIPLIYSKSILSMIVDKKPKRITMTLPNHSFNKMYDLAEGEFRHDDHYWEPTHEELQKLLSTVWSFDDYDVTVEYLGDSLKSDPTVCTTFGIHLKRKD